MTDNEELAQWAMDRARKLLRAEYVALGASAANSHPPTNPANPAVKVLARIIETYEKPPVDPDLEIAREAAALAYEGHRYHDLAGLTRAGKCDNDLCVIAAHHALRIARERRML